mgnify:CR=1 FL=1
MKYPVISLADTERLSEELLGEVSTDVMAGVKWVGSGSFAELEELEGLADDIRSDVSRFAEGDSPPKDEYEGRRSVDLYRALEHLPLEVVDDPGFWRFVILRHLWEFVGWRQPEAFASHRWDAIRRYVDGRTHTECVALRMFIRGRIAVESGNPDLAFAVPEATDLWRSHIIRVRTGYSPTLAGGVLRAQLDHRLTTDHLRQYAKKLNRVASNVVLHVYDENAVDELLEELRDR